MEPSSTSLLRLRDIRTSLVTRATRSIVYGELSNWNILGCVPSAIPTPLSGMTSLPINRNPNLTDNLRRDITGDALAYALEVVEFPEDKRADLHSRLLNEYYSLDCFPGAVELLQKLKVILTRIRS